MSTNDPPAAARAFSIDPQDVVALLADMIYGSDGERLEQLMQGEIERRLASIDLLTVAQIAERTGWHPDKVRRLLRDHKVKAIHTAERGTRYRATTIEQFLKKLEA